MSNRVLIVGATGTFGRRLTEHLAATTDFEIIVGARRLPTAHDFAALLRGRFPDLVIEACVLDASTVTPSDLRHLGAWCVVDTAGPFQGSGQRLAEIAIAAGCHYVDISDARDFVAAFPRLDAAAKCAAVLAVTGASSIPALGQLVLDHSSPAGAALILSRSPYRPGTASRAVSRSSRRYFPAPAVP
jgi:saccharopine dehydrogenase-like NADP-dependent oxidoreductase